MILIYHPFLLFLKYIVLCMLLTEEQYLIIPQGFIYGQTILKEKRKNMIFFFPQD